MKLRRFLYLLALSSCLVFALSLVAVTTFPVKVKCPVCGQENDFFDYASWGSYVYSWPSKFQMVFWPHTYGTSLYICKRCHYAAWLWDFKELKADQVAQVRKALDGVSGIPKFDRYSQVPMSARLNAAEVVYRTLGRDDEFWSHFYRVQGYHFAVEKKGEEASRARAHARELLTKLAAGPKQAPRRKEYLVSLAAMDHFLGDDHSALEALAKAKSEKYSDGENATGYNQYLDKLIDEYTEKIRSKTVPADEGGDES